MCDRAVDRVAFGKPLADQGVVREWVAESRVRLEQLRLLVLRTAWLMDTKGNKAAHSDIQAIKIATPATVQWILDKAIQLHGAGGLSQDFPLAYGSQPRCGSYVYAHALAEHLKAGGLNVRELPVNWIGGEAERLDQTSQGPARGQHGRYSRAPGSSRS